MRKLVFILLAFIAAVTFIRAYDTSDGSGRDISEAAIRLDAK
jgi:predicted small secreted protein